MPERSPFQQEYSTPESFEKWYKRVAEPNFDLIAKSDKCTLELVQEATELKELIELAIGLKESATTDERKKLQRQYGLLMVKTLAAK